jgi:trimethylamine---corrinoid protein Co-methyltransferase
MANNDVRPKFQVLTPEQINRVHETVLKILVTDGVRVDDENAKKLIEKAGGRPVENNRVQIPEDLVHWAIKTVPSEIKMYDRSRDLAFELNGDGSQETIFGVGVTNLFYQKPENDDVIPFERQHMATATLLGNALDQYDVVATSGAIRNLPPETADIYGALEMIANTKKPLILLINDPGDLNNVFDLYEHLHGDIGKQPFIIPYFNPITPLVLNPETTAKMESTIARGVPFIFSNYGMSGATCPITPAGTLAVLTAELLAGLVYSQLLEENTPVILGSQPSVFDMRNMGSLLSPQYIYLNIAGAEMMNYYKIPHAGSSGSGTGWAADILGAGTAWMNHLTSCLGKVGMAPFVGGNIDSMAFSPTLVVYANEIIRQSRQLADGFSIDDEAFGLDDISKIGPGGNYLASKLTQQNCRDTSHMSKIWPTYSIEKWQEVGQPKAEKLLQEKTSAIISELTAPQDHDELLAKGETFISNLYSSP